MNNLERIPTMEDIITVLEQFAPVFSDRVWRHGMILSIGAIPRVHEGRPVSQGTHGGCHIACHRLGEYPTLCQLSSSVE